MMDFKTSNPSSPSAVIQNPNQSENSGPIWRDTLNMVAVMLAPDKEYLMLLFKELKNTGKNRNKKGIVRLIKMS